MKGVIFIKDLNINNASGLFYNAKIVPFENGDLKVVEYEKVLMRNTSKDNRKVNDGRVSIDVSTLKENEEFKGLRADSLTRSRNLLISYVANNMVWKSFITLTFKDNITDLKIANRYFAKWRKCFARYCFKKLGYELKYVCVPEYQKRGAVHYHLLTNVPCGCELIPFQFDKSQKMYNVIGWNNGFTSAFDLSDTDDDFNVALYLTKYLYKDLDDRLYGHTRVMKSKNLELPKEYLLTKDNFIYQHALKYIKQKYDIVNAVSIAPTVENPYIVPSTIINFSLHEDDTIIADILTSTNLEF